VGVSILWWSCTAGYLQNRRKKPVKQRTTYTRRLVVHDDGRALAMAVLQAERYQKQK
jgi:hypothetical protein